MQRAVAFNNARDDRSVFFRQKLRRVIPHVAKPLHNNGLGLELPGQSSRREIFRMTEELLQCILDTTTCRLGPTLDAARIDRFTGDTRGRVDVRCVHAFVLVRNPRHFALACAHVGSGDVL